MFAKTRVNNDNSTWYVSAWTFPCLFGCKSSDLFSFLHHKHKQTHTHTHTLGPPNHLPKHTAQFKAYERHCSSPCLQRHALTMTTVTGMSLPGLFPVCLAVKAATSFHTYITNTNKQAPALVRSRFSHQRKRMLAQCSGIVEKNVNKFHSKSKQVFRLEIVAFAAMFVKYIRIIYSQIN